MIIEVYGRPMCDACEYVLHKLDTEGVPYKYFNVEHMSFDEIQYLMNEMAQGTTQVPIIFIEGRKVSINEFNQFFEHPEPPAGGLD